MYTRDWFYRDELEKFTNEQLRKEWDKQYNLIYNDDSHLRPNNRMTMNIIENILEEREVAL